MAVLGVFFVFISYFINYWELLLWGWGLVRFPRTSVVARVKGGYGHGSVETYRRARLDRASDRI